MTIISTRPIAMPGAAPEAATREVLRMREIGADEADLHFGGGPEATGDISVCRAISKGLRVCGRIRSDRRNLPGLSRGGR